VPVFEEAQLSTVPDGIDAVPVSVSVTVTVQTEVPLIGVGELQLICVEVDRVVAVMSLCPELVA
jgi:hypothetical protein